MKLELKHLAPYLPYNLGLIRLNRDDEQRHIHMNNGNIMYAIENSERCKPILRPMSDLDKPILTKDGYRNFAAINELYKDSDGDWVEDVYADYSESPSAQIMVKWVNWWLFENHFDVFGLIEKGLAIDINTLENV